VADLAEKFLDRFRRGERPPLTEYTDAHPEHAERIRKLFPALVMMEQAAPGESLHMPGAFGLVGAPAVPIERVGD
jgi:hypothetical protein